MKTALNMFYYLLVVGSLGFIGLVSAFVLTLSGEGEWLIPLVIGLVFLFVLFVHAYHRDSRQKTVRTVKIFAVLMTAGLIHPLYELYQDSIPTVSAEVNVFEYQPFTDNKLKPLDETPDITFTKDIPRLDGATALYPLYAAAAEMMYPADEYDPYASKVLVSQTPEAYTNLIEGRVDAIFVAGPSQGQLQTAEQKGVELQMTPIGREAFVFFTHANNPVEDVTLEEIQGIYSGQITNWSELGGKDDKIRAFQRPVDSGSQTTLLKIMGDVPVMEAPAEDIQTGMGGIIHEVSEYKNHKNAIGYTFRFYGQEMVGNDQIKYLAINGVKPTKETIGDGSYPFGAEFYIITTQNSHPEARKLVDWFTSKQGQRLLEHAGYVPLAKN
ncbi:PstS family phosphate ABC transporter substrate-binding protein [Chryseomicrobium palamuruense]|uniref:PstS family phosphate ABC transporter substrate-binding protein n=1 Tax=Chryseomicrobium palamuruense TaxID=682973 RepID=A0ABV8URV8_9BACL